MESHEIVLNDRLARRSDSLTLREVLEIGLRRKRTFGTCFLVIFLGAVLAAILLPLHYESEMKILVHRERLDPLVTAQQTAAVEQNLPSLTEEDINSEVAILRSEDLLENVVTACGLQNAKQSSWLVKLFHLTPQQEDEHVKISKAARKLDRDLRIDPVKKSFIISVSYSADDPQWAAHVLGTYGNLYLEKHASVVRPNDAVGFFDRETVKYQQALDDAEKRLADFDRDAGIVTDESEKESSVPKLAEFELSMRQTQANIPQAEEHLHSLEALLEKTPPRITTQLHTADNGGLMQQLKSSLVNLEAQRTDLTTKYAPGDRMVREVESQIAQVHAAIDAQEKAPLREETTDQNPTYEFLRQELVKAKADLASLRALAASSERVDKSYQQALIDKDQKQLQQQALLRDVKAAEANYLLYQGKREEARISDAFDKNRILNVSIAQAATVPFLPTNPVPLILILGWIFACLVSSGVVFVQDRLDTSLRTPAQIESYLDVPVLGALPGREHDPFGSITR
jgi:succinoglycan biosynthesis transport protein ExoP